MLVKSAAGLDKFNPQSSTCECKAAILSGHDKPSNISVEGEFAQILPNPNPINNNATGDPNGVAFIDDFAFDISKLNFGLDQSQPFNTVLFIE